MQWNIGPIEADTAEDLIAKVKQRWTDDYSGQAPSATARQFESVIGCLESQVSEGIFGEGPYTCAVAGQTGDGPTVFNLHVLSGERLTGERFLRETAKSDTAALSGIGTG